MGDSCIHDGLQKTTCTVLQAEVTTGLGLNPLLLQAATMYAKHHLECRAHACWLYKTEQIGSNSQDKFESNSATISKHMQLRQLRGTYPGENALSSHM